MGSPGTQFTLLVMIASHVVTGRCVVAFVNRRIRHSASRLLSTETDDSTRLSPWNDPELKERQQKRKRNNNSRFRQHINPLSRKYQQQTVLSEEWPIDVFSDCSKPLHLDIGCGKGGFLIDLMKKEGSQNFNYLGLEIRPMVAQYAKERIPVHGLQGHLDFLGCNANVDLERLLQRYQAAGSGQLTRVSIQYPDPHFKTQHAKRRVVTADLVNVLARFLPQDGIVFLQSDIQNVLEDMRDRFDDNPLFLNQEEASNILGVPTEREISVLEKGLPVYRALFARSKEPYS